MNGRLVFEHAVKRMVEVSRSLLAKQEVRTEDISLLVPHQANKRINSMVAEHLGLSEDRVMSTIERYGNTTAATIPIGLADAVLEDRLPKQGYVLCPAFGSGFTWGAALLKAIAPGSSPS
jgi:3-oxoacyl-[acyl-carrier-protein] synthase-3